MRRSLTNFATKSVTMRTSCINNIDSIVFDLGGVIIDLDRDAAVEALAELGLEPAEEMLDPYVQRGPFLEMETGKMTAAAFYDCVRLIIGNREVSDFQIQTAFNKFLVDLPAERLTALRMLRRQGFRLFALSNTNPVMYNSWINQAFKREGLTINDYFDGIVCSFEEGMCKPDPEIFSRLCQRYGLTPSRTALLDDAPMNVAAARLAGLRALQVGYDKETDMLATIQLIKRSTR